MLKRCIHFKFRANISKIDVFHERDEWLLMSFVRFETMAKVVELGSFTAAAWSIKYDTVCRESCGGKFRDGVGRVFIRAWPKKGITLTDIGETLLPHIREVLNRVEKIQQEIALTKNIESGLIRIGTFASASACLLPKLLVSYQKKHPKIEFKFYEGTYEEILEWLDSGIIDVGFVVKGKADEAFHLLPLMKDKMVVAYHENHRFKRDQL